MNTVILILITFYGLWIVLTCLHQFHSPKINRVVNRLNFFRLLPVWTFFAPHPGISDYHLLYRTCNKDGTISPFSKISLKSKKNILGAIWNPDKRAQKSLSDYVQEITRMINSGEIVESNQHNLKLTFSYISVLNYCCELMKGYDDKKSIQFMILETYGYREVQPPRVILNSDFHRI